MSYLPTEEEFQIYCDDKFSIIDTELKNKQLEGLLPDDYVYYYCIIWGCMSDYSIRREYKWVSNDVLS
jgi:hypothetical protein